MDNAPDIIKTQIIPDTYNQFWSDVSPRIKGMDPLDNLVVSLPLEAGSATETQLLKMLQACALTPGTYNLLQLPAEDKIAWHQLRDALKPKNIILLGVTAEQLGIAIHFMPHQVNRFNDCSFIPTLSVPELEQQPDIKKHLWNYGLKPVFVEKIYG